MDSYFQFLKSYTYKVVDKSILDGCPVKLRFYRLTHTDETHNGLRYKDGLNEDILPFNPSGSCSAGGMYFVDQFHLSHYEDVGGYYYIRRVFLCRDSRVYVENGKYKTDRFILGKRKKWKNDTENYIDWKTELYFVSDIRIGLTKRTPEKYKTYEWSLMAVAVCGYNLKYVPVEHRTKEVYDKALEKSSIALKYVPLEYRTKELCERTMAIDHYGFKHVPREYKTLQMCDENVSRYPPLLKYVPEELITYDMCIRAARMYSRTLKYVPERFKTEELCSIIYRENPQILLKYISHDTLVNLSVTFHNALWHRPSLWRTVYDMKRKTFEREYNASTKWLKAHLNQ